MEEIKSCICIIGKPSIQREGYDIVYCTTQKEAERLVKMLEASSEVIKDSVTWCFPEKKR